MHNTRNAAEQVLQETLIFAVDGRLSETCKFHFTEGQAARGAPRLN